MRVPLWELREGCVSQPAEKREAEKFSLKGEFRRLFYVLG